MSYFFILVFCVMLSISSGLKLWSINHTLIHKNSELKAFENMNHLGDILLLVLPSNIVSEVKWWR